MKKIFLTGGNGFFGKRFTNAYSSMYEVLSTDVDTLDITDERQVIRTIIDFKPDYIVHGAAVADTGFCDKNKELARKINVDGAKNVAEAAKEVDAKLVFFSTEQVFNGNTKGAPFKEIDEPVPNTQYGITKLEAEGELRKIHDKLWILRFTWLFGLPERNLAINPNILWDTINAAIKGEVQKVPCNEYRGLTYVYDVIDQFEKVFDLDYGTYHTGSNNDLSRYDISRFILEKLGMDKSKIGELLVRDEKKYSECARNVRLDTGKIKRCGFVFDDTVQSIEKCLKEFRYLK